MRILKHDNHDFHRKSGTRISLGRWSQRLSIYLMMLSPIRCWEDRGRVITFDVWSGLIMTVWFFYLYNSFRLAHATFHCNHNRQRKKTEQQMRSLSWFSLTPVNDLMRRMSLSPIFIWPLSASTFSERSHKAGRISWSRIVVGNASRFRVTPTNQELQVFDPCLKRNS